MDNPIAGELASALRAAYSGTPIPPIRTQLPENDVDAAYAVQEANTAFWVGEGRRIVGCKIGLTSRAVQKQLGVDRPDFGILFADMAVGESEPIAVGRVLQPKIEAEIAFVLGRDLDLAQPTSADIMAAVSFRRSKSSAAGSQSGTSGSSTRSRTTRRPGFSCSEGPPDVSTDWTFGARP